jgi:hypothetical protein
MEAKYIVKPPSAKITNSVLRTKCYNYREYNHWAADCPKPKKKRPSNKKNHNIHQGFNVSNLAESLKITSTSSSSGSENADDDPIGDYAFMVTSMISSHAYAATIISGI